MYKCADCRKVSKPKEGQNKVTVQTRRVVHTDATGRRVGEGDQIVKEKAVCSDCFEKINIAKLEVKLAKVMEAIVNAPKKQGFRASLRA